MKMSYTINRNNKQLISFIDDTKSIAICQYFHCGKHSLPQYSFKNSIKVRCCPVIVLLLYAFLFSGVSPDEIVRISAKYHDKQEQNSSKQKGNRVRSIVMITFKEIVFFLLIRSSLALL